MRTNTQLLLRSKGDKYQFCFIFFYLFITVYDICRYMHHAPPLVTYFFEKIKQ